MRNCYVCKEEKPDGDFYKDKSKSSGFKSCCKQCSSLLAVSWKKRQEPEKQRDLRLKSLYGIGVKEYNQMFIEQEGKCLICNTHQSEVKRGFAVDHCHTSGKVRGLLCHSCNTALGSFKDNPEILLSAIKYLSDNN